MVYYKHTESLDTWLGDLPVEIVFKIAGPDEQPYELLAVHANGVNILDYLSADCIEAFCDEVFSYATEDF